MTFEHWHPEQERQLSEELQQYLAMHEAADARFTLDATYIPSQIGGTEGAKTIYWDQANTPHHLAKLVSSTEGDPVNIGYLQAHCEQQAEGNMVPVLLETLTRIEHAKRHGVTFERIFVPDAMSRSAQRYPQRLARVAQEFGVPVVIPVVDNDNAITYETMYPPYATSPEAYWTQNPCRIIEQPAPQIDTPRVLEQFLVAFSQGEAGAAQLAGTLQNLSSLSEATLQALFTGSDTSIESVEAADILRAYATTPGQHVPRSVRSAARIVLAKIRDPECQKVMGNELEAISQRRSTGNEVVHPLGYYLRGNPDAFAVLQGRAQELLTEDTRDSQRELNAIFNVLAHADEFQCADFMTSLLAIIPGQTANSIFSAEHAIFLLPNVLDAARKRSRSPEQDAVLAKSESRIAQFLAALLDKRAAHFAHIGSQGEPLEIRVAASLLTSGRDIHRPLMKRYVMWLFERGDSLITNTLFAMTYCRYRDHYGDLDAISNRIYPPPAYD